MDGNSAKTNLFHWIIGFRAGIEKTHWFNLSHPHFTGRGNWYTPGEVKGQVSAVLKASGRPGLMDMLSVLNWLLPETMAYNSAFFGSGPASREDTWEMGTHLKCQQVACFSRAQGVTAFIRKVGSAHRAASRRQAQRLQSLAQLTHPRVEAKSMSTQ